MANISKVKRESQINSSKNQAPTSYTAYQWQTFNVVPRRRGCCGHLWTNQPPSGCRNAREKMNTLLRFLSSVTGVSWSGSQQAKPPRYVHRQQSMNRVKEVLDRRWESSSSACSYWTGAVGGDFFNLSSHRIAARTLACTTKERVDGALDFIPPLDVDNGPGETTCWSFCTFYLWSNEFISSIVHYSEFRVQGSRRVAPGLAAVTRTLRNQGSFHNACRPETTLIMKVSTYKSFVFVCGEHRLRLLVIRFRSGFHTWRGKKRITSCIYINLCWLKNGKHFFEQNLYFRKKSKKENRDRSWAIVSGSFLWASFKVSFSRISKTNAPLQRCCN